MPAAQLMMGPAEIVGASDQVHPRFQCRQAVSRMPEFAGEGGEAFAHSSIEALDQGRIEHVASPTRLQSLAGLGKRTLGHLTNDLPPFLLGSFDHLRNTELRPHRKQAHPRPAVCLTFSRKARWMLRG